MKKLTTVAAALSLGAIAALQTASAQDTWESDRYSNPSGAYLGAGWGRFDLKTETFNNGSFTTTSVSSSNDNAWKGFVGYRFNPFIAIEGDYIDLGRPSDRFTATGSNGNYRVNLSGFAPYLIGTAPLGPVELFAKGGWFYYDVKTDINFDSPGPGQSAGINSTHNYSDFAWGAGIGTTLFKHLNLRAEYERFNLQNANNSNTVWLDAAWRF